MCWEPMRIKLLLLMLLMGVGQHQAQAQNQSQSRSWSLSWNNRYQSSLHESSDFRKRGSWVSTLIGNVQWNETFRLQGVAGGIQAFEPAMDFRVINPEFRGFWLATPQSTLKLFLGPTLVLPLGTDAREESLLTGVGVGARLLWSLSQAGGGGWTAFYDLTFSKNFHQYETSVFSQVNTEFALNHLFYLEYGFDSRWSVNAAFGFSSFWSYFGVISNNYSIEQEVSFQVSPMVGLSLSHLRGGDFLSPNGQNFSFDIFDADASRVTVGVSLSI